MSNLAPIAPHFTATGPSTLILKEKRGLTISGDSGKIKDANGNLVFNINAQLVSMSARRTLTDSNGVALGQVRKKKTPGLHVTYYLGTMNDEKKCAVKAKGLLNPMKCDADIYLGDTVIGEASGSWRAKSFKIDLHGKQVATISRKTGMMGRLLDADSYVIEIAAGVDTAFISMIVIALDEIYHDEEK